MKLRNVTSLVVLLLAASAVRVGAWSVCVHVECADTHQPLSGVRVKVESGGHGPYEENTDQNGDVCVSVFNAADCYTVSLISSTIPGLAIVSPVGGQFTGVCTTGPEDVTAGTFVMSGCIPPAGGCPECVDPKLGLKTAAGCTVLELSTAKVSITGPAGCILGDICIAPGGSLAMSGDEFLTGTVNLGAGAHFSNSSHGTVNVSQPVDLTTEISDAYAAAVNAAAMPCAQSYTKLDGSGVTTITGGVGVNVICVGDIVLGGKKVSVN